MRIGINIFGGVETEVMVECFKKFGVDRTFLMSEKTDFEKAIQLFSENGIICESLHAPFNKINDMWRDDDRTAQEILNLPTYFGENVTQLQLLKIRAN